VNRLRAISAASLLLLISQASVAQQSSNPREQLNQYVADLQKNPADDALREKIIKLALTLQPSPTIPAEVHTYEGRAERAFKDAKSPAEFVSAADEYKKALLVAPWVAMNYFNRAVVLESAGELREAVTDFKLYVLAAPNADDITVVQKRIGGLEFELEKQETNRATEERTRTEAARSAEQSRIQAQRARELEAERERQRLRDLDPLIRSLNGATYRKVRRFAGGTVETDTYTVDGEKVISKVEIRSDNPPVDNLKSYLIEGLQFYIHGDAPCPDANICGSIGTIAEDAVSFYFMVNGQKKTGQPYYVVPRMR
jgi:tetratricopeptide (TPR) repeat protein